MQHSIFNKKSQSEQSSGVFFNLAWNQHRSSQVTLFVSFLRKQLLGMIPKQEIKSC